MKNINLKLFGEQSTILSDWLNTDKHCIDIIHAGSGKTFLASLALPIFASDKKYHHGKDIVYSAPTREMIASLVWEPLKKSCKEYFNIPDKDINNSNMTIKFPGDIFIRCKSAEQRENLRGMNAAIWVADEAALYTEESLQEISNRLRPSVGSPESAGRMIVISTPHGKGPLYSLYKVALDNPEKFIVRHFDYKQMRSGNKRFIEEQKKILSPLKFEQDYNCKWESVADQFFYTWKKHLYAMTKTTDIGGDLVSFHDWNKKRMTAIVARVEKSGQRNGTITVLKSYAIPDCSTEGIAQAIRQDFPKRRISSVMDMSGAQVNRDTTSEFGVTDKTILEKYGFVIVNTKKSNPLISDTDNTSNAFINRGGLIVDKDDLILQEALETYHFEDGTRKKLVKYKEAKYMHIDGLGDCLRYGIHHFFPINHNDVSVPDYQTNDPRYIKRPGSEHLPDSPLYVGGPTWEQLLNPYDESGDSDSVVW